MRLILTGLNQQLSSTLEIIKNSVWILQKCSFTCHCEKTSLQLSSPPQKARRFSLAEITHEGVRQMVSASTSCLELADGEQYHSVQTAARSEPPSEGNTCLQYEESLWDAA